MTLRVLSSGPQTLVQDPGRFGLGSSGVGRSGAFDRTAMHQANALVGNQPDEPVLEVLGGGLRLRASREHVLAVTGAVGPILVAGVPVEHGRAFVVAPGQEVLLDRFEVGLRGYVSVAGSIQADPMLGSRSTDTLSALGPPAVGAGDDLRVGFPGPVPEAPDVPALITSGSASVDVVFGPRADWFTSDARALLLRSAWTVSDASNRIGIRLDGPTLQRSITDELPSEPCVFGSVQVTSAGLPVVLGPDHPVTGGYPVIAVVADRHLDRLAQLRPDETLRFRRA